MTLVAYLITGGDVHDVANLMKKQLEYSTKVSQCSMMCEFHNHPRVVSTLHNGISYKLYIVRTANQVPMDGTCFRSFSDAYDWATGGCVEPRLHSFTESCVSFTRDCVGPWSTAISELESKWHIVPGIKRIEQNIKKGVLYTTVIWMDGSKPTVVKLAKDDPNDLYFAVASAIAIKLYGSNSAFKRMIKEKCDQWK